VAMPSTTKKAISTKVSDSTPLIGQRIRITPAASAMAADSSAHQKPGALRIQNVVTSPTPPEIRNSQPDHQSKRQRRHDRHDDRREAEQNKHDAFEQEQAPMAWMALATSRLRSSLVVGCCRVIIVSLKSAAVWKWPATRGLVNTWERDERIVLHKRQPCIITFGHLCRLCDVELCGSVVRRPLLRFERRRMYARFFGNMWPLALLEPQYDGSAIPFLKGSLPAAPGLPQHEDLLCAL